MKRHAPFGAALLGLAMLGLVNQATAQTPGQLPGNYVFYEVGASDDAPAEGVVPTSGCSCESGECGCDASSDCGCGGVGGCSSCDSCATGGGGMPQLFGPGLGSRNGQWFAGADYLNVRSNFSEATAFVHRDATNFVDTYVQYQFDYNSSYRLYGGYRMCDCCGEVRLTFTRLSNDGTAEGAALVASSGITQVGPLEVVATLPGQRLIGDVDVNLETYDADFARTIPLGSPLSDCAPCNWCPAWDIKWFAGLRGAEVGWTRNIRLVDSGNATLRTGRTVMDFEGAGIRVGLDGRRYIGPSGWGSIFARGAISGLVGDVNYTSTRTDVATPGVVPTSRASFTRVIPVTELEAGGSLHFGSATISAGYLIHAWHDLGMGDDYDFGTSLQYDDANILGFDGWFARAEVAY